MLILNFFICPQIEDETQVSRATQGEQDNYEMHVRAANIVSGQGGKHPCRSHRWTEGKRETIGAGQRKLPLVGTVVGGWVGGCNRHMALSILYSSQEEGSHSY